MKKIFTILTLLFVATFSLYAYTVHDIPDDWSFSGDTSTHYSTSYSNTFQKGVKYLQALLNADLGKNLSVDGGFGYSTETAVKSFQEKYNLSSTNGEVDDNTKRELDKVLSSFNIPSKPAHVTASNDAYVGKIRISGYTTPEATSYKIYRATSNSKSSMSHIDDTTNSSEYWDTGSELQENVKYYYRVKACNDNGCSDLSDEWDWGRVQKANDKIDVYNKLTFRDVKVNTCKTLSGILVRYVSGNPITFDVSIEGSGFSLASSSSYTVSSSNKEATIPIKFCPTSVKTYSGKLKVTPRDTSVVTNRDYVSLTGNVIDNAYPAPQIYEPGISSSSSQKITLDSGNKYKFKWDSNRAGVYQQIYLFDRTTGSSTTRWTSSISQTTISNLQENHQYFWKMRSCDGNKQNCGDYSKKLYFTVIDSTNIPHIDTISPNKTKPSMQYRTVTLEGKNLSNATVEISRNNNNYIGVSDITYSSNTKIKFKTYLVSLKNKEILYVRVKKGDQVSNVKQINIPYEKVAPLIVSNIEGDELNIKSGQKFTINPNVFDIEDIISHKPNYTLKVKWSANESFQTYTMPYLERANVEHTYPANSHTNTHTITIYAIDNDNLHSARLQIKVNVSGTKSDQGVSKKVITNAHSKKVAKQKLCVNQNNSVGRSVDRATGEENFQITPMVVHGAIDLPFTIKYSSILLGSGEMGKGWSHNYNFSSYIEVLGSDEDSKVRVHWDNSNKKYNDFEYSNFDQSGNIIYKSNDLATIDDVLVRHEDDTFLLKRKNKTIYNYDKTKFLKSIKNFNRNITISFDNEGRLKRVTEPVSGQFFEYEYNNAGQLYSVKDKLAREVKFTYNQKGLLTEIIMPNFVKHTFHYNDYDQMDAHYIVDNNGIKHQFFYLEYYENGKVAKEYDGKNIETEFTYDTTSQANKIDSFYVNKNGEDIETIYDDTNFKPLQTTYPDHKKETFAYYENGKLKRKIDRANNSTWYYYDNSGNLEKVKYSDNSEKRYTYDSNRNLTVKTMVDKNGKTHTQHYTYDSNNNLTKKELPNGDIIEYTYNSNNQMITKTLGGKTTHYEYDNGKLAKTTSPGGIEISYTYDNAGRLKTETNPQGGVTTYTYDVMDHITAIKNPAGKVKTFEYDFMGNKISETDFKGNKTEYKYDNNGNLVKKIDALGHEYRYEYDSADRLKKSYDPSGNYAEYVYDSLDRVQEIKDKRGNSTTFVYDAMGNLKEQYDAYGNRVFTKVYDAKNNLVEVIDALNNKTKTDYNVFDKPVKVEDPLHRVTQFKYDDIGRLTEAINAQSKKATQKLRPDGQIKQFTDAGGSQTVFTYDDDGKPLVTTTASGSTTTNIYDTQTGLLSKYKNGRQQTKTFTYDLLGRVKTVTDPDGQITYTYDDNSNLLTIKENGKTATYTYDALNRMTSYTDINGQMIRYAYDAVGNLTRLTYPDGHEVIYVYDPAGNLTEVKDGSRTTAYEYDKNNRMIKMVRPNGTALERVYNDAGQLTSETDKTPSGSVIAGATFVYDDVGNIKEEHRTPPPKPLRPISLGMTYAPGNLLDNQDANFDADDNLIKLHNDHYHYDSRNRLIASGNATYTYDSENHRISQTVNGRTTTYTNDPNAPLSQLLAKDDPDGTYTTYTYGRGLISQTSSGHTLYYHYDLRGSTIALTNENGQIVDRWSYLPYGGQISHDKGTTQTPFLYNGRDGVMTDENGLYYMRARYYNPAIRRFINRDTLLGNIGEMATLNRFGYVNGNPVSGVDPMGLYSWDDFKDDINTVARAAKVVYKLVANAAAVAGKNMSKIKGKNLIWALKKAPTKLVRTVTRYKPGGKNLSTKILNKIHNFSNAGVGKALGYAFESLDTISETYTSAKTVSKTYCITEDNVYPMRAYAFGDAMSAGLIRAPLKLAYTVGNFVGLIDDSDTEYLKDWVNKNITIGNIVDKIGVRK